MRITPIKWAMNAFIVEEQDLHASIAIHFTNTLSKRGYMDNSKRAEKMKEHILHSMGLDNITHDVFVNYLTSQLDKAVREAVMADREDWLNNDYYKRVMNNHRDEGFAAAREKAAGIADRWANKLTLKNNSRKIAVRIRAMEVDK